MGHFILKKQSRSCMSFVTRGSGLYLLMILSGVRIILLILVVKQSHIGFSVAVLRKMKVLHMMRRDLCPQLKLQLWMVCYE